ncbi:MAG TPA: DNA-directed RNA polymerase subunit alpha C-terminal domain-containing protein [Polyangiaceae bacterium]|nr:DNA-directed RNA polymerase subunit alpha C-terminal domain-containing protein [Polyangiaceae bacterium]
MDSELAALPIRQMDLSGTTMKAIKPTGMKTVGDLLSKSPTELATLGLGQPSILEIARAASELGFGWVSEEEVRKALPAGAEPLRPALPKALLKRERVTYVLSGELPRQTSSAFPCPRCNAPLVEVAHIDLSAFPDTGLSPQSLRVGRCEAPECQNPHDPTPHGFRVELGPPGVGARPVARKEFDYPDLFDAGKTSDRIDSLLVDQQREIGPSPRVGGWPHWGQYASRGWPKCAGCKTDLVLAFEQNREDDAMEHVLICPKACVPQGVFIVTLM